uniref:Ig-like domain-containing protein n=1 Tax=Timema monikensis TaxID=170555 RepID=A0A7R9HM71_9NEOP|nr:unnamed protein product [Timema monikensis]
MVSHSSSMQMRRASNQLCVLTSVWSVSADAPPVLLYSFIEQTLQPGPAVSLKCSSAGNPTPQISWTLDGFPLPSNGRLQVHPAIVQVGDNGPSSIVDGKMVSMATHS